MENSKQEKAFVKVNQSWQKATILEKDETQNTLKLQLKDERIIEVNSDTPFMEIINNPAQKYAKADVKDKLEGDYISYNKLPDNVIDAISKGKEYLHTGTYVNEGELKESVKMIQMRYDAAYGSRLHSQYKVHEAITRDNSKTYNHTFSKQEFDKMVKEDKYIEFDGISNDGEVFKRLAYYEPALNAIRTKPILTDKTYFLGKRFTQREAKKLNAGEQISVKRDTKKGVKTYLVSYNPKAENFGAKDQAKVNEIEATTSKKDKNKKNGQGVPM